MSIALMVDIRESTWAAIPGPCPGFSCGTDTYIYIYIYIYSYIQTLQVSSHPSAPAALPQSILTSLITPQHPLECPQGGIQVPPNAVPCSQAMTLSQESTKSHHLQIPPLQHPFSSARGRRERCQNQASCGCEHGKGSCSLSQNPHLLWHMPGAGDARSRQCRRDHWILQYSSLTPSPSTATQAVNGIRALQSPHSL